MINFKFKKKNDFKISLYNIYNIMSNKDKQLKKIKNQLNYERKKTAFAWGQYYGELEDRQVITIIRYEKLQEINANAETPQFIIDEMKDMIEKLKLELECPICFDIIDPKQIEITRCGHKYCKKCADTIRKTTQKCALCKKTMKPKK
jgi:hypothetical protein